MRRTWLCPGGRWSCPGHWRRHHLHPTVVQRAFGTAVRAAGISKRATCHTLRHVGLGACRGLWGQERGCMLGSRRCAAYYAAAWAPTWLRQRVVATWWEGGAGVVRARQRGRGCAAR
jgi:hypothetical protein